MKLVIISDTNMYYPELPEGDVLIHCGFSNTDLFSKWMSALNYKHKIVVAGNHDLEKNGNFTYLQDSSIVIDGIKFYGSYSECLPDMIPDDTDVLITNVPPRGVLEHSGGNVGCSELLSAVQRVKPKIHCFGNINYRYGQQTIFGTHFINAAIYTEQYLPKNQAIEVEI